MSWRRELNIYELAVKDDSGVFEPSCPEPTEHDPDNRPLPLPKLTKKTFHVKRIPLSTINAMVGE
jgi:hypothetical protein